MPRLTKSVPKYRRHKPSGRAVVTLHAKDFYLGDYGSAESKVEYERLIAEYLVNKRQPPVPSASSTAVPVTGWNLTIQEIFLRYWKQHVVVYYVKHGEPTSEQNAIRLAIKPLIEMQAIKPASEFGPADLKTCRQRLIDRSLCRKRINQDVGRIKRMFKWACENELVPATVYHGLTCVSGLRFGRSEAHETEPVKPVPDELVDEVLKHAPSAIGAMIQLQRLTGMRPGEVTIMRACDIDASGPLWVYTPPRHKTEHHGRSRIILLGPQAQKVVTQFWKKNLQAYMFSPKDVMEELYRKRRAARKTPMTPSQLTRRRKRNPEKSPSDHYTSKAYGAAVAAACRKSFPPSAGLSPEDRNEWAKAHHWSPGRLRHSAATYLRKHFGLEAARIILGHASSSVTEVYAEKDMEMVADIMAKVG